MFCGGFRGCFFRWIFLFLLVIGVFLFLFVLLLVFALDFFWKRVFIIKMKFEKYCFDFLVCSWGN